MWGGNPSWPGRVFIDFFVSRCNVALFVGCVFPIFFSLSSGSVHSLFFIVEHFSGGCFSNNQHFSVFYITFWNCFTDLVPFFFLLL